MKKKSKIWIYKLIVMGFVLIFTNSCDKDDINKVPVLTTSDVSNITQTTATCGGNITSDDGSTITVRGVCWSTGTTPTIADSITTDGTGTGSFISYLYGLNLNTTYYVRAYATNSAGTGYGSTMSFTTQNYGTLTDIDGNVYNTVTIGSQTWMAENLKTTKYNDGNAIPNVTDATDWGNLITPAYCWYDNNISNKATYGALYNCYTVNTDKLAPTGWHIPTDAEWTILENYLIANGFNYDGTTTDNKYAKALASATGWDSYTGEGTVGNTDYPAKRNVTNFTALPGGYRSYSFNYIGNNGYWWSATDYDVGNAWSRSLYYNYSVVYRGVSFKQLGFSVRCVRDN